MLEEEIFSVFSGRDRADIWSRLERTQGLVPFLTGLFKNNSYLQGLVDCIKSLTSLFSGETYCDLYQRADRAVIQVAESSFASCPANLAERVNLGYQQLFVYAIRHYLKMPQEPQGKSLLARPTGLRQIGK